MSRYRDPQLQVIEKWQLTGFVQFKSRLSYDHRLELKKFF